jgi:Icc-related predicted phosphoesterase
MGEHYSPMKPSWLSNLLENLPDNVFYLENNGCEIEGVKFWGSPVTPWFGGDFWVFNKHRGHDIKQVWEQIPLGTHVVITHGPVMYKCDYIPHQQFFAGCEELERKVQEVKPILHLSGHIHEGYSWAYNGNTEFFNGSVLDGNYEMKNDPWEIELNVHFKEVKVLNNILTPN